MGYLHGLIVVIIAMLLVPTYCIATAEEVTTDVLQEKIETSLLEGHKHVVVCYVSILASLRPSQSKFSQRDFDSQLCTHLIISDIGIRKSNSLLRISQNDNSSLSDWANMKKHSPHLNVTFSVGESNDTTSFSKIAANVSLRKSFIESVLNYTVPHGFDGVDINLAYITESTDKMSITTLLKELQDSLSQRGLTLTATLGAKRTIIDNVYDLAKYSSLFNWMHIMSFDYHGAWDAKTGPNAPLYSNTGVDELTVMATIQHLKSLGALPHKLVLGVPMFGHTFELSIPVGGDSNISGTSFNSKALTTGFQGSSTQIDGFMGYSEICMEFNAVNSSWKQSWDDVSKTPYAQDGKRWISYDDERSIKNKAFLAIQQGLAGLMAWRVDLDDFRGDCSGKSMAVQRFPLLNSVNVAMTEALDNPGVLTVPKGNDSKDLSILIGITLAVLLCAMVAMLIRLIHLRIHSNFPTFF